MESRGTQGLTLIHIGTNNADKEGTTVQGSTEEDEGSED